MYLLGKEHPGGIGWNWRIKVAGAIAAIAEAFETLNVVWSCHGKRRFGILWAPGLPLSAL